MNFQFEFEEPDFLSFNSISRDPFEIESIPENLKYEDFADVILGNKTLEDLKESHHETPGICIERKISNLSSSELQKSVCYTEEFSAYNQEKEANEIRKSRSGNSHHNFQKHTVTALRALINQNILKENVEYEENLKTLETLWRGFLEIKGKKVMTKRFLFCLFCAEKSHLKELSSYGFSKLFSAFSEEEIILAQKELRNVVKSVLTDGNIRSHVEGRKLERKEEFIAYLAEYRDGELATGSIKKRMSKESSYFSRHTSYA